MKTKTNKKIFLLFALFALISILSIYAEASSIRVSLANQVPDPAKAGGIVELWFRVENIGTSDLSNVAVEILPEYPFSLVDQSSIMKIPSLSLYPEESRSKTIRYRLKVDRNAPSGQYNIKVKSSEYTQKEFDDVLNEEEGIKSGGVETFTVYVTSQEVAEIIYIDKSNIVPGKETDLTFTINNVGSAPLENLEFSWTESNGYLLPVKSDNVRHVKFLDIDQSIDLTYKVMASTTASSGLYPLNLKLKFDSAEKNGTTIKKEINTITGVFLGGETDFKVTFGENAQGQTSLTVANTGSVPALSVSVNIPEQEFFSVTGSKSAIIGNLDKGDYTLVNFQLTQRQQFNRTASNRAPRTQTSEQESIPQTFGMENRQLKVIIEYTDTTGSQKTVTKLVPVQLTRGAMTSQGATGTGNFQGNFRNQRQQSFWTSYTFLIPFAIIILSAAYFVGRKKAWWSKESLKKLPFFAKK
jgi:hypothetical protein